MHAIRDVSSLANAITVEGGCILAEIQAAAIVADRYFPLSLGAEGSSRARYRSYRDRPDAAHQTAHRSGQSDELRVYHILGAASYLFIVGEIAPLRPRDEDDGWRPSRRR